MELEVANGEASNDNNNATSNPPIVIITKDCSSVDSASVGAGDGEGNCHKTCDESVNATNSRIQQLIIENYDSNLSDGDLSSHSVSDNEARESTGLTEFVEPSEEQAQKIINQVEFYFSDANILKDTFLLKHVRRNKEGFVSLKLVTSFKKMKPLTKDYRVVAYCLRQSNKLVVNEEKMKVRRVEPLPNYDETTPSRTVVVINIPSDNPTVDSIAEIFSKCGDIALIRILRPGKPIPQDVKKYADKHPEIGLTICAIVEFENHQFAKDACDKLSDTNNWRQGMRVVLLAATIKRREKDTKPGGSDRNKKNVAHKKKSNQLMKIEQAGTLYSSSSESEASQMEVSPSRSESTMQNTSSNSLTASPRNQRRRNLYGKSKLATSTENMASPETARRAVRGTERNSGGDSSPATSPWVRRRLKANEDSHSRSENSSPRASPSLARRFMANSDGASTPPRMLDMSGVLRQPQGPDGTPGFAAGRGRGAPSLGVV